MYHFVSGYTSKLAGTEVGVTEPKAAFSACFGAPFMSRQPSVYARILADKMHRHEARCVMLNTGWSGGPYGVGRRMPIAHTRAMLDAALSGDLHQPGTEYHTDPYFNLKVPKLCPDVPPEVLDPRSTWSDEGEYEQFASRLRDMFRENFERKKFNELGVDPVM